jgi:SpoIID/LytB domain protein
MSVLPFWSKVIATLGILVSSPFPSPPTTVLAANSLTNPELQVGILQRFGEEAEDQVEILAPQGAQLTLSFADSQGYTQSKQTNRVTIGIMNQALTAPEQVERLILSSHKAFESAYASALEWQQRGIETEVAQPGEWQVWAERDRYTSEQHQQILRYAQDQGLASTRLFQEERSTRPLLTWTVNNYRYHRNRIQISSDAGWMRVGDYLYAGSVTIQPNAYGSYTVVNAVPLETYLRGVVPHEIGPGAPTAAIEAQAILARTYALRNLHRFVIDDYQLCANTHCQVYRGLSDTTARTDAAIEKTAGQVLTFNGDLIDAVYSSTNGGISAAFEDIWEGDPRPYLQPVVDRLDPVALDLSQPQSFRQFLSEKQGFNEVGLSRFFRWQKPLTFANLTEQLRNNERYLGMDLPEWQQIAGLQILQRSASGRVQQLQVDLQTENSQHSFTLEKEQIRLAFPLLLSTMFALEPLLEGTTVVGYTFLGGGFGHGVGMSQYGSYGLANQGFSAPQILGFYYPGTTLAALGSLSLNLNDLDDPG